jgi:hypothetical protein
MINDDAVQAYNTRITATLADLRGLTPQQADAVKNHGSKAEALLKNHDLVMFIHQFRFEVTDALAGIAGHDPDSNARRVALSNHLTGIDQFVASLQRAVYMKNRVVSEQEGPAATPRDATKEIYKP